MDAHTLDFKRFLLDSRHKRSKLTTTRCQTLFLLSSPSFTIKTIRWATFYTCTL